MTISEIPRVGRGKNPNGNSRVKPKIILWLAGLVIASTQAFAQIPVDGTHYPAGLEGLQCGAAHTPGFYFRDDNLFYYGTAAVLPHYTTYAYLQAIRLEWVSDRKLCGASYGASVLVPLIYKESSYTETALDGIGQKITFHYGSHQFGPGDILVEPLGLQWQWSRFDLRAGVGVWLPTGEYHKSEELANLGDGMWSPMVTLGGTWYLDKEKTWTISGLNHLELNCQTPGSTTSVSGSGQNITRYANVPCTADTFEWGIGKTFQHGLQAGLAGYYQKQFTQSSSAAVLFNNSEVAGIGPEISGRIERWKVTLTLRDLCEFTAVNRPQGNTLTFSVAKKF